MDTSRPSADRLYQFYSPKTRMAGVLIPSGAAIAAQLLTHLGPFKLTVGLTLVLTAVSTTLTSNFRLPETVKPTHYALTICTDLEKLTFSGRVEVSLEMLEETSTIVANIADLLLENVSLSSPAFSKDKTPVSQEIDTVMERAIFKFGSSIPSGVRAKLIVNYRGDLTGGLSGYYKSSWVQDGAVMNYASTQFEPIAARRAFPCWDEPSCKATFDMTMVSRRQTTNLSNMPVAHEEDYTLGSDPVIDGLVTLIAEPSNEWKVTRFEASPLMSTYLLAWANGPFGYVEDFYTSPLSSKTRPLRIYTTKNALHQAKFILEITAKVVPIYEMMFGIEYPLPKLDTLAIDDMDVDAMENWGLIIGRKSAFLLDPELADMVTMKRVATTQSHETAHMWFGNITTMAWWDNLYLNEGFASIEGEVVMIDRILPEWKVDSEFITGFLNEAMWLDAKPSSHPIEAECPNAADILQIFDALSYAKAASVLRMLSNYVGEQSFLQGVSLYLKSRLYGNSVSRDLWDAISEVTGLNIVQLMHGWVSQMGFPVVMVREESDKIVIRQERFWESGPACEVDPTLWSVPLCISYTEQDGQAKVDNNLVLGKREMTLPEPYGKNFKLNASTKGVYRVLYSGERLLQLAMADIVALDPNDKMGIIHDAMTLGLAGYSQVSVALAIVDTFHHETEYLLWSSISSGLTRLVSIFWENDTITLQLDAFRRHLYGPLVARLGMDYSKDDPVDVRLLRTHAIEQAAAAGHKPTVRTLQERFSQWVDTRDDTFVPADLMQATYTTAVRHGTRAEYNAVKAILRNPKTPTAGIAAIHGLCSTRDSALVQKTLDFTLNDAREQDILYFFEGLQANHKTRGVLTEFFRSHYDQIHGRFKNSFALKHLIEYSHNALSSEEDYRVASEWFQDKDTSNYHLALRQSLDAIKARAACVQRSTSEILEWLKPWQDKNNAGLLHI